MRKTIKVCFITFVFIVYSTSASTSTQSVALNVIQSFDASVNRGMVREVWGRITDRVRTTGLSIGNSKGAPCFRVAESIIEIRSTSQHLRTLLSTARQLTTRVTRLFPNNQQVQRASTRLLGRIAIIVQDHEGISTRAMLALSQLRQYCEVALPPRRVSHNEARQILRNLHQHLKDNPPPPRR